MNDYSHFPPFKYFLRVLKNCPKSALLYAQIWHHKGKFASLCANKADVRKDYFLTPTLFRNLLGPLMCLNLIHFIESDDKFQIEIMGQHQNE